MSVTYYVVPFRTDESGDLVPLEPMRASSAGPAKQPAVTTAASHSDAVAFSRAGEPATGDFEDAVVLARYGVVPTDLAGVLR